MRERPRRLHDSTGLTQAKLSDEAAKGPPPPRNKPHLEAQQAYHYKTAPAFLKTGAVSSYVFTALERKIVRASSFRSGAGRLRRGRRSRRGAEVRSRGNRGNADIGIHLTDVESPDAVEPAALILVRIYVERDIHLLSHLNVEALQAVFSKYIEHHLLGIGVVSLNDKTLNNPFSSCRSAAAWVERSDNFSL